MSALAQILGSYRAEWLKLSRRPATWILGIILLISTLALGYAFIFLASQLVERSPATPNNPDPLATARGLRAGMLPSNLLVTVIPLLSNLGGPIALILGALAIGSEYSWGTMKTILTQRPGRLSVVGGKLLGLAPILLIFAAGTLLIGLLASLLYAAGTGSALAPPGPGTLLKGIAASWLILAAWATLGVALATLFRSAALAIGLGLVYALALENIIGTVAFFVDQVESFRRLLLGANTGALSNYFADPNPGSFAEAARIPPERATLVLLAYLVVFLAITGAAIRQRDVN